MLKRFQHVLALGSLCLLAGKAVADKLAADFAEPPAPPYIGVSYYPEVAGAQITDDIARLRDIGVNLVRFGEFAWSRMETNDGQYDFGSSSSVHDGFPLESR